MKIVKQFCVLRRLEKTFVKSAIQSKFQVIFRFEICAPKTMQTFCERGAAFRLGVLPAWQKRSRIIARIAALKSRSAKFMGESALSPFCKILVKNAGIQGACVILRGFANYGSSNLVSHKKIATVAPLPRNDNHNLCRKLAVRCADWRA